MAAVDVGARNVPPVPIADDLDDLFNYDVDVFRDVDTNIDVSTHKKPAAAADGKSNATGLGIDEEIKVTKKRAPVPKLDENRLLGPAGIPRLRRITKDRLSFKGKGHEYSDVTRLLNVFQLWLDDLYPRAKFADGLAIIEKLGHTKRMQTMRKEWINEGKPTERSRSVDRSPDGQANRRPPSQPSSGESTVVKPAATAESPTFEEDTVDKSTVTTKLNETEGPSLRDHGTLAENLFISDDEDGEDQPPEDDLDALLAEDQGTIATTHSRMPPGTDTSRREDNFEDDMEAMAGMDDMW